MTSIHVLVLVGFLEVAINRVAVPMLRPAGTPPWWHTCLDYTGLFLFYFTGALAALVIAMRCWEVFIATPRGIRATVAHGWVALAGLLAAIPLVIAVPATLGLVLEVVFAGAVIALVVSAFGRQLDLGIQIGLGIVAIPLLFHTAAVGAKLLVPDNTFDGPDIAIGHAGVIALSLAALTSPYCFAPRPFARAVSRPAPVIFAMAIAGAGAIASRFVYSLVAQIATLAIGVELNTNQADPRLALYLLAIATLSWTLVSCAIARSESRRKVGAGLALIVLGGYGFHWPHHYLLPLLGLALIVEAIQHVRNEELADEPITSRTPPISDPAWASYITALAQGLKRTLGEVHTLTARGEAGLTSSVIVGEANGMPVRARIERIDGCVLALDVVLGREFEEVRGASLTLSAIPGRNQGLPPEGPPATPLFKAGDAALDERFKIRGNALALTQLLDAPLRARVVATLDGWLAYWACDGLRYRVYPGRGAPLDHPMPLSDLALGRGSASTERLVAVIELLVEIAARGVALVPIAEPSELDMPEAS